MALTDQLTQPRQTMHGLPCSIGSLLIQLDGSEKDALLTMLGSKDWNAGMIYDALRDEGYVVGRQSINRHRGKRCRCEQVAA